ncbi:MAG: hypothetical protein GY899_12850 [Verrucomicrobiaceae bacterium]|nr:hypothetical protein [Verrucomicrobiaceae bacterium]
MVISALVATVSFLVMQMLDQPTVGEDSGDPGSLPVVYESSNLETTDKPPDATPKALPDRPSAPGSKRPREENGRGQPIVVTFKKPGGEVSFTLKSHDNDLSINDHSGNDLARVAVTEGGQIQFQDTGAKRVGYLAGRFPRFQLSDVDGKGVSFEFRRQSDGDWKLKRPDDTEVCRVGKRDYGWKIEDGSENFLARIKVDDGRTSLRDSTGQVLYYTNDAVDSLSIVPFGMPKLTRGQATALSFALMKAAK